jgi:HEAT repeat protein
VANQIFPFLSSSGIIGWVVVAQAVLLGIAVVLTSLFLVSRAIWLKHKARIQDDYGRILIELLFETSAGQSAQTVRLPKIWFWQESIFRDVILHQIHALSGDERATLIKLYVRDGYLANDQKLLQSRAWWVRLRASIRMDLLTLHECAPFFTELMKDPNLLVALCATRALSRLSVSIDEELVFATLERVGNRRREAAIEVLSNLVAISGPNRLIQYLEHKPESPIAISCVRILGDSRAVEAAGVLLQILNVPSFFPDDLITEVLEALRKIGDPSALDLAKATLHHSSPTVRATSVLLLQEFGETLSPEDKLILEQDASVEVRRALQKNRDQEEAA